MAFNMHNMMKQAQEMQARMEELQAKMAEREVEGVSGGGMVRVVLTCKGEARKVTIDPSVLPDKEIVEDLVKAAINNARVAADQTLAGETKALMESLGLPAGALPF